MPDVQADDRAISWRFDRAISLAVREKASGEVSGTAWPICLGRMEGMPP